MKYKKLNEAPEIYAIILDRGDDAIDELKKFAQEHELHSAHFTAIGAFSEVIIGYFDYEIKDYRRIPVREQVEVISMMGDISWYEGKPVVHAHIVLGKYDGNAVVGHLLHGVAHPTLEIILERSPVWLQRAIDEDCGLPLINIEE